MNQNLDTVLTALYFQLDDRVLPTLEVSSGADRVRDGIAEDLVSLVSVEGLKQSDIGLALQRDSHLLSGARERRPRSH